MVETYRNWLWFFGTLAVLAGLPVTLAMILEL
ncbi:hypothetical protein LCGC14_0734080 [marine sediment metagenome]|uniref:Uncharacterized protein n=1 Tax=marine sediment metagenome TaxID=412755 RepID=A0A0F9STU7_9ZZZZ